eukprot:3601726-Prymnesium_polylepis.1
MHGALQCGQRGVPSSGGHAGPEGVALARLLRVHLHQRKVDIGVGGDHAAAPAPRDAVLAQPDIDRVLHDVE